MVILIYSRRAKNYLLPLEKFMLSMQCDRNRGKTLLSIYFARYFLLDNAWTICVLSFRHFNASVCLRHKPYTSTSGSIKRTSQPASTQPQMFIRGCSALFRWSAGISCGGVWRWGGRGRRRPEVLAGMVSMWRVRLCFWVRWVDFALSTLGVPFRGWMISSFEL